jgi:hypothetical protein
VSQELPVDIMTGLEWSPLGEAYDEWAAVNTCPNTMFITPTSGQGGAIDLAHRQAPDRPDLEDVPLNRETEAQLPDGEMDRDLPSEVLEHKIAGNDAASSGADAMDHTVLEQCKQPAEACSVPRELPVKGATEQRSNSEAKRAGTLPHKRRPRNKPISLSDQECATERVVAKVEQTTERSSDMQLGSEGDNSTQGLRRRLTRYRESNIVGYRKSIAKTATSQISRHRRRVGQTQQQTATSTRTASKNHQTDVQEALRHAIVG